MTAPSLKDLPNELLLEVFELLAYVPERIPIFASLCRTSRRFRTLAEPILYQYYSNLADHGRPHVFPLSLVKRRELSKHVKRLYLLLDSDSSDELNPMLEDDFRVLRHYLDESRPSSSLTHDWINNLARHGRSRFYACTCLVLALASQGLEELILQHDSQELGEYSKPFWLKVIEQSLDKQPAGVKEFYNLRSITISRMPYGNGFVKLYPLAAAFKLPCLRHFELNGCSEMRLGTSNGWDAHGQLSRDLGEWESVKDASVETLIFNDSDLTHYALWVVLTRCKRLKQFTFKMAVPGETQRFFYFPRLDEGLRAHAASLERLFIMHGNEWAKQTFYHPRSGRMTCISQCTKLSSAVVPHQAVLPPDCDYSPPILITHIRKALPASVKNWILHPDYFLWGDTKAHL